MKLLREDFPKDEYEALLKYLSDTDDENDVDVILDKNPEQAAAYTAKIPDVPLPERRNSNVVVLLNMPTSKPKKLRSALNDRLKSILNDEALGLKNTTFTLLVPTIMEVKGDKQKEAGRKIALLTFNDQADIKTIVHVLSQSALDTKYPFSACRLDDVPSILAGNYNLVSPEPACHSRANFRDWLLEHIEQEQFAYRCGSVAEVVWLDALARQIRPVCSPDHERFGSAFYWSPMGSYLLTLHRLGVWLRGNYNFQKLVQLDHEGVRQVIFSPNEELLITCNDSALSASSLNPPVIVWNCCTGDRLKTLELPSLAPDGSRVTNASARPVFAFSHDSTYLAARSTTGLTIYETATMTPMDDTNKSAGLKYSWLTCPLAQFQWSPANNYMSIWIPETGDTPGRLLIVDVDKKQEVASKNVFSVTAMSMHWSDCGEYLALNTVIARRVHKKNKKEVTQIEVFKVKEKSVPVDIVDLEGFTVKSLHWEKGHGASRFATVTVDEVANTQKILFFEVPARNFKQDTKVVQSMPISTKINDLSWSPAGQYFVAASKGNGEQVIFGVLNEQNKVDIITVEEHMDLTDILWDPSGRFVTTACLQNSAVPGFRLEGSAGFRVYSFLGRLLYRLNHSECRQFMWRPRPPPMITKEKLEEVCRRLKEYSKQFDAQDEARRQARLIIIKEEAQKKISQLEDYWKKCDEYLQQNPMYQEWQESWQRLNKRLEWTEESVVTEKVIQVIREPIEKKKLTIS